MKELLREQIAKLYLESPDFNGVAAASLMTVAEEFSVDPEIVLTELVAEGAVYANFGHEMVNPHPRIPPPISSGKPCRGPAARWDAFGCAVSDSCDAHCDEGG